LSSHPIQSTATSPATTTDFIMNFPNLYVLDLRRRHIHDILQSAGGYIK
jgi:hypothetical protein